MFSIICVLAVTISSVYGDDDVVPFQQPGTKITSTSEKSSTTTTTMETGDSKTTTITKTKITTTSTMTIEEILELTSCNSTFILENNERNTNTLEDEDLLLNTLIVASKVECAQKCCETNRCCKAVHTQNAECLLYSYIRGSQLPVPAGATVIQQQCCYDGEQIMGEVTLHLEKKTLSIAKATCEAENMTLAMPKTECAFNILKEIAEAKRNNEEEIFWIGITNPTERTYIFNDGDTPERHGFELPLAPAKFEGENEKDGILWFYHGNWWIGDWQGHHQHSFFCQSKTS